MDTERPGDVSSKRGSVGSSPRFRSRRGTSSRGPDASRLLVGPRLGRCFGIDVVASWSLLAAVTLVVLVTGFGILPHWWPEWTAAVTAAVALAAALGFLGSVLLHELARALMARTLGGSVRRITLFALGGLAREDHDEADSPAADLMLALAGPLVSGALGALSLGLGLELAWRAGPPGWFEIGAAGLSGLGPAALFALWLGAVNLALLMAVLAPAFPLDGGRALRSALWAATGDLITATRWAVRVGRGFALLLLVGGAFSLLHGAFVAGLWLALLGWLLNDTARRSYERVRRREARKNVPLERVMRKDVLRVHRDLTVDEFVCGYLTRTPQRAFPVEDRGRLLGILRLADVRKLPQHEWRRTRAVQVMRAVGEVPALSPDAAARDALDALTRRGLDQLPVVDRDHLVGVVTRSDLLRWLEPRGNWARSPRPMGPPAHARQQAAARQ